MKLKNYFFIYLLFFSQQIFYAIDPTITINIDPPAIGTNETAQVTINVIDEKLKAVPILSMESTNFTLSFIGQSTRREANFINNNMHVHTTYSYIFQYMPKTIGNITIPAFIAISKKGKKLYSPASTIQVKATDALYATPSSQRNFNPFGVFQDSPGDAFLQWRTSTNQVLQNTGFIVDLYLFSDNPNFLNNFSHIKVEERPRFEGGVLHEFTIVDPPKIITEYYGYTAYYGTLYKRYIGFPLEKGTVPLLPPLLFNNNGPFSTYIQGSPIKIYSIPISDTLTYIGNNLDITAHLSTTNSIVNEPLTLTLRIVGDGNIDFFVNPFDNIKISNLFISNPSNQLSVGFLNPSNNHDILMEKTFVYRIIPQKNGKFQIPPIILNYLHKDGTKHRAISKKILFESIDTNMSTPNNTQLTPFPKTDQMITYSSGLEYFIPLFILGLCIMIGAKIYTNRLYKMTHDEDFARSSSAKKRLTKIMTSSEKAFKNNEFKQTAQYLRQSILYFCTDKFSLNPSSSPQEIIQYLINHQIKFSEQELFLNLLSTLEFYAFAVHPSKEQIANHMKEAYYLLDCIDKISLKKAKR